MHALFPCRFPWLQALARDIFHPAHSGLLHVYELAPHHGAVLLTHNRTIRVQCTLLWLPNDFPSYPRAEVSVLCESTNYDWFNVYAARNACAHTM